jgi:hypothetical protein
MTDATSSGTTPRVSTSGAWFAVLVATWAAATVAWHVAWLSAVNLAPVFVGRVYDRADERSGPAGLPEPYARFFDLAGEALRTLGPYARIVDASAAMLGVALFCAAFALLRGAEVGRRATRTLLALKALHTTASAAWLVVLFVATLEAWRGRFVAVVEEIARDAPRDVWGASPGARAAEWIGAAPTVFAVVAATSLAITAVLFRAGGRPSVRAWCSVRGRRGTVDSSSGPR